MVCDCDQLQGWIDDRGPAIVPSGLVSVLWLLLLSPDEHQKMLALSLSSGLNEPGCNHGLGLVACADDSSSFWSWIKSGWALRTALSAASCSNAA